MKRVAVVGAGVAGLSAAYRLASAGLEVILLEASRRHGGCIATQRQDGFLLEEGPDAFLTTKPAATALAEALGLGSQLIGTNPDHRRSFILRGKDLVPVPEGFYLLAPSSLSALARAPLFSWRGRLRMALEPLIPARRTGEDETLASFVRRRLGREALERFAQPMVGGIYTADPEKLSLAATFPQFLEMERTQGGVIRGIGALPKGTSGARYGLFASFSGGMQTLTDVLASRLPEGTSRLETRVEGVVHSAENRLWRIHCQGGKVLEAHGLCVALPAGPAGRLFLEADEALAIELMNIPYADCATVNLAFQRGQVAHPLDAMGFVVPAIERRAILSCSFSDTKFPGRAPADGVLLRAFVGGALQPDRYALDDAAMTAAVLADLRGILGISGEPLFSLVRRHPAAMPQYHLGHLHRLERIEAREALHPALALAGNYGRGAGIPDCVAAGQAAAERLLGALA